MRSANVQSAIFLAIACLCIAFWYFIVNRAYHAFDGVLISYVMGAAAILLGFILVVVILGVSTNVLPNCFIHECSSSIERLKRITSVGMYSKAELSGMSVDELNFLGVISIRIASIEAEIKKDVLTLKSAARRIKDIEKEFDNAGMSHLLGKQSIGTTQKSFFV